MTFPGPQPGGSIAAAGGFELLAEHVPVANVTTLAVSNLALTNNQIYLIEFAVIASETLTPTLKFNDTNATNGTLPSISGVDGSAVFVGWLHPMDYGDGVVFRAILHGGQTSITGHMPRIEDADGVVWNGVSLFSNIADTIKPGSYLRIYALQGG